MNYFLPLRSFGDFIIDCYILQNSVYSQIDIIALPSYLMPLQGYLPQGIKVKNFELAVKSNIVSFFTHKHFFTSNCINELICLKKGLSDTYKVQNTYLLEEYDLRNSLFQKIVGLKKCIAPQRSIKNVYAARWKFFCGTPLESSTFGCSKSIKSITVFPDSRLKRKEINQVKLDELTGFLQLSFSVVRIAMFKSEGSNIGESSNNNVEKNYYSNFRELEQLIISADFVISCDSMPLHLANLLRVPHYCIYNNRINHRWLTPYIEINKAYCLSTELHKVKKYLEIVSE